MGQIKIKVNEAIARAESMGKKIYKKDLAAKIWAAQATVAPPVFPNKFKTLIGLPAFFI